MNPYYRIPIPTDPGILYVLDADGTWDPGWEYACHTDSMEIVRLLFQKGARDVHNALAFACKYDRHEIATYLMDHGACPEWLFFTACHYGRIGLVELFYARRAYDWSVDMWNEGLRVLAAAPDSPRALPMLDFLVANGATDFAAAVGNACFHDRAILHTYFLRRRIRHGNCDKCTEFETILENQQTHLLRVIEERIPGGRSLVAGMLIMD